MVAVAGFQLWAAGGDAGRSSSIVNDGSGGGDPVHWRCRQRQCWWAVVVGSSER